MQNKGVVPTFRISQDFVIDGSLKCECLLCFDRHLPSISGLFVSLCVSLCVFSITGARLVCSFSSIICLVFFFRVLLFPFLQMLRSLPNIVSALSCIASRVLPLSFQQRHYSFLTVICGSPSEFAMFHRDIHS